MATTHDHDTDLLGASCCTPATGADLDSLEEAETSQILSEMQEQEIAPEVAALRSAGFELLLEHGQPVDQATWASRAGVDEATLADVLTRVQNRGRVELDDEGRLLGLAGLTIRPTRHRLDIAGEERWTWCALDALGIFGALAANGTVYSTDPSTGEDIEISFTGGVPGGDASLFILGGHGDVNVKDTWCPKVNFFNSRHDAESWVEAHELEGEIVSAARIAEQAADMWRPVVDISNPQVC